MSDLQVALIVLGAFIIAGVVIYNWLQERKLRNQVAGDFIVPQKDVLADDFSIDAEAYIVDKELAEVTDKIQHFEHTVPIENLKEIEATEAKKIADAKMQAEADQEFAQSLAESSAQEAAAVQQSLEQEITAELHEQLKPAPIVEATVAQQYLNKSTTLPETTHAQIDLSAIFYLTKNIKVADLSALIASFADIKLPLSLHGLDNDDKWHLVNDKTTASFKQVACSMQLADRGGPIAKNLLNKFQFAVEDAGLELNAHVEWQGSGDAMQRAIELDKFCIEVDQLISVHLAETDTPIHGTKFKGLAEASGMTLKEDGKFYYFANEAPLFTAIDSNNVPLTAESLRSNVLKSVTFQIEIPKVNNCEQVFSQMIVIAQKMAASLNASLVDDNQRVLGDIQIERIRQQLKVIHATMVARGIMPGSPASMRLFN